MRSDTPGSGAARGRRRHRLRRGCGLSFAVAAVALAICVLWLFVQVRRSLPQLSGELPVAGLSAPLHLERDALGIPVIRGENRFDVAYGLGFAHGQDRFFQMDLMRRQGAGELAALFGPRLLRYDRSLRRHRFRSQVERHFRSLSEAQQSVLGAYAAGVNRGLGSLRARPFEYLLLRAVPEPWKAQDSLLVQLAMFQALQDSQGDYDRLLSRLKGALPPEVYDFLTPWSTAWDSAAVEAAAGGVSPVPGPEICSLEDRSWTHRAAVAPAPAKTLGASNAWAVSGPRTASGKALLAADMHVPLTVPNLWYRASFDWTDAGGERRVSGITLPGSPLMVAGSNGSVAWAFTNSRVDATDLIEVEEVSGRPGWYRTPEGPRPFETFTETIPVKGEEPETVEVRWTRWGPVMQGKGEILALRWVAHKENAVNLELLAMETAHDVDEALAVAQRSGLPALNFLVADRFGDIGWTLAGRLPRRAAEPSGRELISWQAVSAGWSEWLAGEEIPRRVRPESGLLWNANNRAVGGEELARLGDGNYVLAARAGQIEDQLRSLERATVGDMLDIQLDDRALFLERWQRLLLEVLAQEPCEARPRRCEFRRLVEAWGGRAAVDSAGYTLVRQFHRRLSTMLSDLILEGCGRGPGGEPVPYFDEFGQADGPLWRLVEERPRHLLPASYDSWRDLFLEAVDAVISEEEIALPERHWGHRNRLAMGHFFGGMLPFLGRWLNMSPAPLPGDAYMPRVQAPGYGSSQRLAVSPGLEGEGYFHMPGGQSGHPLSRHFRDGHEAWIRGEATPFLPGEPVNVLVLRPQVPGSAAGGIP